MNNRSFANRLTWRIIGIVSGIFIISFIVVGVAMQYISTNEETTAAPWRQILDLILMLIVGIVHTGIAYVAYFASMDGLKIQSIALLSYIDPVSALFFSAIFLKEPLSALGIIGAVMIIGSAIVSETGSSGS